MKSAEQACMAYASATADRRKYHEIVCAPTCVRILDWDSHQSANWDMPETARPETCLDDLFSAPRGPDGEFPRHKELFDKCCEPCKAKLGALTLRADAGRRIGAVKRSIGAIGKRLLKEAEKCQ